MNKASLSEHLAFALQLAAAAEEEILSRFHRAAVEHKPDGSEVTEADRAAEVAMRRLISERYPDHGVLGEEGGERAGTERYRWILDPIDGTAWFALGIPKFGSLIGLMEGVEPVLGVIHLPVTGETMYAERGGGCWYRRGKQGPERVQVDNGVHSLEEAFISAAGVHRTDIVPDGELDAVRLSLVLSRAGRVRFVGDCVQHMLVARGRLHAAIDPKMYPWDIAALVPCVREAGGVVTSLRGETDDLINCDSLMSVGSPGLHAELLEVLNS